MSTRQSVILVVEPTPTRQSVILVVEPTPTRQSVILLAEPTSTPVPVVDASGPSTSAVSGNLTSRGNQSNNAVVNAQVSVGSGGRGTGSTTVQNELTTNHVEQGIADGQSGVAVAGTGPGGAAEGAQTLRATTGDASASGSSSQNTVVNSALAVAQVQGANNGVVEVHSSSSVLTENIGVSDARTGPAGALPQWPAMAATGPNGLTPGASGTATADGARVTTALTDSTTYSTSLTGASATPFTFSQHQAVWAETSAYANARTAGACAGTACWNGAAPPVGETVAGSGSSTTLATSGSATARGLTAQNVVQTNGDARVTVRGENYSLISIIVESITAVFNRGYGGASTGAAVATGGGSGSGGGVTTASSSGDATASGLKVQNRVDLQSSATVNVQGDNRTPIDMFLDLFAGFSNWGSATAWSGNAATGGGGKGGTSSASSGSAHATGLEAQNVINMSARAHVNVEGNNYAPIRVRIRFISYIDNEGIADARTGNALAAGGSNAPAAAGSSVSTAEPLTPSESLRGALNSMAGVISGANRVPVEPTNDTPLAKSSDKPDNKSFTEREVSSISNTSGYAVAIGNVTQVQAESHQHATANTSGSSFSSVDFRDGGAKQEQDSGSILTALDAWSQSWQGAVDFWVRGFTASTDPASIAGETGPKHNALELPDALEKGAYTSSGSVITPTPLPAPAIPAALLTQSGSTFCWGNESRISTFNHQVAAATQGGSNQATGSNSASLGSETGGQANCRSGDTFSGPVPTPTPVPPPVELLGADAFVVREWEQPVLDQWEIIEWEYVTYDGWEPVGWESWEYQLDVPLPPLETYALEYPLPLVGFQIQPEPLRVLTIPPSWPQLAPPPMPDRAVPLSVPMPAPITPNMPVPRPSDSLPSIVVPRKLPNAGDGSTVPSAPLAPRDGHGTPALTPGWRRRLALDEQGLDMDGDAPDAPELDDSANGPRPSSGGLARLTYLTGLGALVLAIAMLRRR